MVFGVKKKKNRREEGGGGGREECEMLTFILNNQT